MGIYDTIDTFTKRALEAYDYEDGISAGECMLFAYHAFGTPLFSEPAEYWRAVDLYLSVASKLERDVVLFERQSRPDEVSEDSS